MSIVRSQDTKEKKVEGEQIFSFFLLIMGYFDIKHVLRPRCPDFCLTMDYITITKLPCQLIRHFIGRTED